jgi:hypothetical protein
MAKLVIKKEDLTLASPETDVYLRFRIVSTDLNRVSAWTPIFAVTPTQGVGGNVVTLSDIYTIATMV